MPVRGVIQSPVLVGRDDFLTLIEERLADAAAGAGRVLFVAGRSGHRQDTPARLDRAARPRQQLRRRPRGGISG